YNGEIFMRTPKPFDGVKMRSGIAYKYPVGFEHNHPFIIEMQPEVVAVINNHIYQKPAVMQAQYGVKGCRQRICLTIRCNDDRVVCFGVSARTRDGEMMCSPPYYQIQSIQHQGRDQGNPH